MTEIIVAFFRRKCYIMSNAIINGGRFLGFEI